jgi:hypothetical protein
VDALEEAVTSGVIDGSELFMFTDNSVAERAYFRGTSQSRLLFELIVRLRNVEMQAGCTIFLVHVSGLRMVASGINGISRGDFNAGVMMGQPLLKFVPLLFISSGTVSCPVEMGFFLGRRCSGKIQGIGRRA